MWRASMLLVQLCGISTRRTLLYRLTLRGAGGRSCGPSACCFSTTARDSGRSPRVLFLGAPGSGKGTYAARIAKRLRVPHISAGDILRAEAASDTPWGRALRRTLESGGLVSDADVIGILLRALDAVVGVGAGHPLQVTGASSAVGTRPAEVDAPHAASLTSAASSFSSSPSSPVVARGQAADPVRSGADGGYVLEGFPRTVAQACALDAYRAAPNVVLVLDLAFEIIEQKMAGRRICASCGAGFNVVSVVDLAAGINMPSMPPKVPDRCDVCGGTLRRRADDAPDIVRRRLQLYERESAPVLAHYRGRPGFAHFNVAGGVATLLDPLFQRVMELHRASTAAVV